MSHRLIDFLSLIYYNISNESVVFTTEMKKMKENIALIKNAPLFRGVGETEAEAMLGCLSPSFQSYQKGAYIYRQGESITRMGMVLSGGVHIQEEDFWGNRSIIAHAGPGQSFGEVYACLRGESLRFSVIAAESCSVMFLDAMRLLSTCGASCRFHNQVIQNLLAEMARHNAELAAKLSHLSQRTTRGKLLSYLSEQSLRQGSASFDIPYNRQQLADYLCVDRSAMSNELSRLRDEGVLEFERNHFHLL